jgi:GIY-YIG catalytic domain
VKYVYILILESLDSEHFYVGIADDPDARLTKHNAGEVTHTSKVQAVANQNLCRLPRRETGVRIREIPQIRIRPGICEQAALMLNDASSPLPPTPQ